MAKILIAVGGTGQEIAMAALRISHLAQIDQLPTVFVIDSDQARSTEGIRTRTTELEDLSSFLTDTHALSQNPLRLVRPLAENIRDRDVSHVRSLFSPAQRTPPDIQSVLDLLFAKAQQETFVRDGFHGEPSVGALAVGDYLRRGDFNDDLLRPIDQLTMQPGPHEIVIAGSTTGGTGPGALPPISRQLLRWREELEQPRDLHISALVQLPWFQPVQFPATTVPWSKPPDIDLTKLRRNSACLVRLYDATLNELADRLLLISLPQVVQRVSAGANQQPETRHYLNLLCGWIAVQLLEGRATQIGLQEHRLYGFGIDDDAGLSSLNLPNGNGSRSLLSYFNVLRLVIIFGNAVQHQLSKRRPDPALPPSTYRLARRLWLGSGRTPHGIDAFLAKLRDITTNEQGLFEWITTSCAASSIPGNRDHPRDVQDLPNVFRLTDLERSLLLDDGAALLKSPISAENDFVAYILNEAGTLPQGSSRPEDLAVSLYRAVRRVLLGRLVRE